MLTTRPRDRPVELQRKKKKAPDSAFTTFAQVQADASGGFAAKVKVKKTRSYRAQTPETGTCQPGTSNSKNVKVKRKKK